MIAPSLEQQVSVLQHRLDEAFERIGDLERDLSAYRSSGFTEPRAPAREDRRSPLFPPDAPVLKFALQLSAEIFPGPVTINVASAPDEASAQWYVLSVMGTGEISECLDRESEFGRRLHEAFPEEAADIRLAVTTL